ncbi:MAG: 23S rRNA (adenine(2503)-C(2))-methyltransferase RlmN [Chlamydiota bacterium]|nr:23S rRNA (adenine(2503)-C(2))-methyltransferase RlmN [Chlamydiota bacterium]
MEKVCLSGLESKNIQDFCKGLGFQSYRSKQIMGWIFKKNVINFDQMNNLPLQIREMLKKHSVVINMKIHERIVSKVDKSIKYLFELSDGEMVEGVYMKDKIGRTVCLSTQVGCPLRCGFCASGMVRLKRNLSASEMVGQLLLIQSDIGESIDRVVFMGMGEPFLNFDALMKAIEIIRSDWGMGIGGRKITVSTAGIVPRIKDFAEKAGQVRLSVSLHAVDDKKRSLLMPVNRTHPLKELIASLKQYKYITGRRIGIEYILFDGVNDSFEDASQLAQLVKGLAHSVNIIEYNTVDDVSYSGSERVREFMQILREKAIPTTLRRSKGQDIHAACGQLRAHRDKRMKSSAID